MHISQYSLQQDGHMCACLTCSAQMGHLSMLMRYSMCETELLMSSCEVLFLISRLLSLISSSEYILFMFILLLYEVILLI